MPLTDQDLLRLKSALGDDVSRWLEMLDATQLDMIGEPETVVETRAGRQVLVFKHNEEGCVFLGSGGCTVHPHRPRACRSYPYDRPENAEQSIGLHPAPLCPPETGFLRVLDDQSGDHTQERHQYGLEVQERDRELHSYAELVMSYNRKQRLRRRLGRLPSEGEVFLRMLSGSTSHDADR